VVRNIFRCFCGAVRRLKGKHVFSWPSQPGLLITLPRWGTLILYGWLAALAVYPLLPLLAYIRPEQWLPLSGHPGLYNLLMLTYALVAVILVLYLQSTFFLRLPRKQFKCGYCIDLLGWLRYPSLHVSVVSGLGFLFYLDGINWLQSSASSLSVVKEQVQLLVTLMATDTHRIPLLDQCGLWVTLTLYGLIQVIRIEIEQASKSDAEEQQTEVIKLASCPDKEFEEWLSTEKPNGRRDFFDRVPYVTRIKNRIEQPLKDAQKENDSGRGQIILGEFGSGKTTIIKMVEKQLSGEWIVSYFDCWQRSGNPAELAAQFMEQIIHDVGQLIEATSLTRLPDSFAHALYGSSHWFSLLDAVFRPDTPEEVIQRLNSLLISNNRKLLIVIENVDRNKERDLFIDVIAAILDKLKIEGKNHIQFIFSAYDEYLKSEDIYRIANYKEDVDTTVSPEVLLRFMAFCLKESFAGQKNGNAIVIPYLSKEFSIAGESSKEISAVAEAFGFTPHDAGSLKSRVSGQPVEHQVLEALADVLSNPRTLKFVLRETYHLWNYFLKGEIHLFDLILYITSQQDGALKDRLKNYPEDALDGSQDSPYLNPMRDRLKKKTDYQRNHETSQPDLIIHYQDLCGNKCSASVEFQTKPAVVDITRDGSWNSSTSTGSRDILAHYILNGYLAPGHSSREALVQPFVSSGGNDDDKYRKYSVILKRKSMGLDDFFDQLFLRNYIDSCGLMYERHSITIVMDCWMKNLPIAYSLTESMTLYYFQSERQAIQFLSRALLVFNQKYVHGEFNFIISDLMFICIKSTDGDTKKLQALVGQIRTSFIKIYKAREYQWGVRVLYKLVKNLNSGYFKEVVDPIVSNLIRPDVAKDFANQYLARSEGCQHLSDHFFLLVEIIVSTKQDESYFSESTIRQCAQTFIKFMALVCEKEIDALRVIHTRLKRSDNKFVQFKNHLISYLDLEGLTESEKQVLKDFENA